MATLPDEKAHKKYRWNCAVKDEHGNSKFWSVEESDEALVRMQIAAKKWTVIQINRVKDVDERAAAETPQGGVSGIAAAVGIVAIVVSFFVPLWATPIALLVTVTAAITEVMFGGVAFGSFVIAILFIRAYFLWAQFSQALAKL